MSGINSGILSNASPLSAEAINELERKVLETGEAYAYLDQDSKLCFAMPHGVDGIQELAWNNAYIINSPINDGPCIRQTYKKTGLKTSVADKLFTKPSVNADWTEYDPATFEADYNYTVSNGEATITSYVGGGGDIIVPNRLGGYPVVAIDRQAFTYAYQITSVIIMEGITRIGANAFCYCDCIRSMYIPSSVTYIGHGAFEGCVSMTDIILAANITTINEYTFCQCAALTDIVIPNGVTHIGTSAFERCIELRSVTIPNSVTSINECAFYECHSLRSIIIPNSVTTIGDSAFDGCYCMTSIVIPDSVTSLSAGILAYCSNLTNVIIPKSVTSVGSYAFYCCDRLTSIVIPDSVTAIGEGAFYYCYGLETATIGRSVSTIEPYTFACCENLTSIIIPESVTSIADSAFVFCTSLTDIYYRGAQAQWDDISIDSNDNDALTNATIHYNTTIDALQPAERLEGDGQEFYTAAPSTLSFRSTAPLNEFQDVQINGQTVDPSNYTLEEGSTIVKLSHEYLKTLDVGSYELSIISNSKTAKGDFTVTAPELNEYGFYYNQPYYVSNASIDTDMERILLNGAFMLSANNTVYTLNKEAENVIVDSYTCENNYFTFTFLGVTITGSFTSNGKSFITSKTFIPGGAWMPPYNGAEQIEFKIDTSAVVCDIDYWYFKGIKDTLVALPINQTKSSYVLPKTNICGITVMRFANYAFSDNTNLTLINFIPNSFSTISAGMCRDCTRLTNINIPNSITSIEPVAFYGCTSLTGITFDGTMAQWNAIKKHSDDWNGLVPATYVQCSDGQVAL